MKIDTETYLLCGCWQEVIADTQRPGESHQHRDDGPVRLQPLSALNGRHPQPRDRLPQRQHAQHMLLQRNQAGLGKLSHNIDDL